ncbi:MAG: ATP-binding protein [Prochloraceae cyanobacterium]|nr:ATP-binding protein [Prochloraceae cyanobacterium]
MRISLFNSLRFKIPAFVLLGTLPLILGSMLYARERASERIRIEAKENLTLKSDLLAEAVSRWNESNILALTNLSDRSDIISMKPERQKEGLVKLTKNYKHIYLAMTIDKNGFNVARSDNKETKYYGDRNYFKAAIAGKKISYQALIGRTTKKPAICLSAPIQKQEQVIVGVTTICSRLDALSEQVGKLRFGQTGYAFVVDPSGKVLAHPDQKFISGDRLADFSNYPPIKNLLAGKSGELDFTIANKKWVSYTTRLNNGWGVAIVQEKAEFFKNKQEFQTLVLFVVMVAVGGVSVVTLFVADRLIKPISNLTTEAIAISNGQLDRKVRSDRNDELGILASSFDRMATQLNSSFQHLEERIAERTSELKKAVTAAEKANKSKDRFLVNISHELRTPLNSILGYTRMLLRSRNLESDQVLSLRIVKQSGTHLLTLINDILDFSKTQADKVQLCLDRCLFPRFLEEVGGIIEMRAREKGLEFEYKIDSNIPIGVKVDRKRLRQILLNLLGNAVKFTERGKVTFAVKAVETPHSDRKKNRQKISFEIIDTGVGISEEAIEKIFQPFEQVCDEKNRIQGTGLGLSISQELVELMGSKIKVKSKPYLGSNFSFELTLELAKLEKIETSKNKGKLEIVGYKGEPKKILVVDDRKANRLLLLSMLEPLGFEIIEAENGKEGLEKINALKPDLILTDLLMPVKTGLMMILEMRQKGELSDIPVISLSASNQDLMEEKSSSVGCQAFLPKPFDEDQLMAYLELLLDLDWIYEESIWNKELDPLT